jgi:hypothetical protein
LRKERHARYRSQIEAIEAAEAAAAAEIAAAAAARAAERQPLKRLQGKVSEEEATGKKARAEEVGMDVSEPSNQGVKRGASETDTSTSEAAKRSHQVEPRGQVRGLEGASSEQASKQSRVVYHVDGDDDELAEMEDRIQPARVGAG